MPVRQHDEQEGVEGGGGRIVAALVVSSLTSRQYAARYHSAALVVDHIPHHSVLPLSLPSPRPLTRLLPFIMPYHSSILPTFTLNSPSRPKVHRHIVSTTRHMTMFRGRVCGAGWSCVVSETRTGRREEAQRIRLNSES
jgi:hypothetical protein